MDGIISIPGFAEPLSCWSHFIGAALAAVGAYFYYQKGRGNKLRLISLLLFTFTLVFLFSMSGVYHLLDKGTVARDVFQRLDHSGIWVVVAGTFTPLHIILFRGFWRWGVLLGIWTVAITGLVLEVVFFSSIPEIMSLSFYLCLGWMGVVSGARFRKLFGKTESINYLWIGGISYSLGAVMEFFRWPTLWPGVIGPHEIFHVFVVFGAAFHWLLIYRWADHPVSNSLTFNVKIFPGERYFAKALEDLIEFEASSREHLKLEIQESIERRFHTELKPATVRIQYFEEEII